MRAFTLGTVVAAFVIAGVIFWNHTGTTPAPQRAPDASTGAVPESPATPVPAMRTPPPPQESAGHSQQANVLIRLLAGDQLPALKVEQLEGYLRANSRSAASLLGAFHATRDKSLLDAAKQQFPNDPRVDFAAATQSDSPEERRKWIDAFKQSAPDNAVANYLSAAEDFKSGRSDLALQEIQAAASKPIQDYQLDSLQNAEEAYRAAGYSEADAKAIASTELLLPDLGAYKNVGFNLVDLANSYQQTGNTASAQAALQLALDLAGRINVPNPLTMNQTALGLAIQQKALGAMDPNGLLDGQTVQSRMDVIQQQRDAFMGLNQQWARLVPEMSDQDLVSFYERKWSFGEQAAEQWVVNKYSALSGVSQP